MTKKKVYKHLPRESSIQNKFIKLLKREGENDFIVKLSDKWYSGLPDVMVISDGKVHFYEIKARGGVVSPIQEKTHEELRRAGATVTIVRG